MAGAGGLMVSASVAVPVPSASVALSVTLAAPAEPGVPEMRPLLVLMLRPAGRPAASKLVGELSVVIW